jgi:hypothetical protein
VTPLAAECPIETSFDCCTVAGQASLSKRFDSNRSRDILVQKPMFEAVEVVAKHSLHKKQHSSSTMIKGFRIIKIITHTQCKHRIGCEMKNASLPDDGGNKSYPTPCVASINKRKTFHENY